MFAKFFKKCEFNGFIIFLQETISWDFKYYFCLKINLCFLNGPWCFNSFCSRSWNLQIYCRGGKTRLWAPFIKKILRLSPSEVYEFPLRIPDDQPNSWPGLFFGQLLQRTAHVRYFSILSYPYLTTCYPARYVNAWNNFPVYPNEHCLFGSLLSYIILYPLMCCNRFDPFVFSPSVTTIAFVPDKIHEITICTM